MPGTAGNPIVRSAIDLLMECPDWPALKILDTVMTQRNDESPDFESFDPADVLHPHPVWSDDIDPPSPFAELLRRAFAPKLDPLEAALMTEAFQTEDNELCARSDAIRERWRVEVVDRFAARYKLWDA